MATQKQNDLKITVKLTTRAPLKASDDLTRPLESIYSEKQRVTMAKKEKRPSTKLRGTNDGLFLARGSWWPTGAPQLKLAYENILQFSACANRPAKVLLVLTTSDKAQTELVVVKTKGLNYANQLLSVLQIRVPRAHELARAEQHDVQPVSYQVEEIPTQPFDAASIISSSTAELTKDMTTDEVETKKRSVKSVPIPICNSVNSHNSIISNSKPHSQHGSLVEIVPLTKFNANGNSRTTSNSQYASSNNQSRTSDLRSPRNKDSHSHLDPTRNSKEGDSVSEVTYYGVNNQPKAVKPVERNAHKQKRRVPRELTNLHDGSNRMTNFDENNTPWEVNISYIKYDPMVGSVESENGPIYMYTAHQLVAKPSTNYSVCESDSSSDGESYTSGSVSDGAESSDEDELERFMMLGRSTNARTNQTQDYTNGVVHHRV